MHRCNIVHVSLAWLTGILKWNPRLKHTVNVHYIELKDAKRPHRAAELRATPFTIYIVI